jgi:Microtubule-Associated protein Jupiter
MDFFSLCPLCLSFFSLSDLGEGRRPYIDSHNRLFGESDRPFTPAKNHMKSSIPIGGDEKDSSLKHSNGNGNHLQEIDINGKSGGMQSIFLLHLF